MSAYQPGGGVFDADRDHLVALLREHFASGHFDVEEFSQRVEILLGSETVDQAAIAVQGLPPLSRGEPAPGRSWWRRLVGGRHAQSDAAQAGWLPTSERFRDPSSGALMRVWFDPADASRHYVPESSNTS